MSLVKVTDAKTNKLKRWENPQGKSLAVMDGRKLVLTPLGEQQGYIVRGKELLEEGGKNG